MSYNLHPSVVSELKVPGATFQIVDHQWDAGAYMVDCEPEVILRWRIKPYRIKAQGWIRRGEKINFGQLMLHPAGIETHVEGANEHEDVRTVVCRFESEWLNDVTGRRIDWTDSNVTPCFDLRNSDIDHAMRRLMRELVEPGFASQPLAEALGISMAVDLTRFVDIDADANIAAAKGALSGGRLRQIHDYIDSFTEGCPTLTDVAAHCGVSVAHLRRMYKSSMGQTLHDYIEEVRVNRAKILLLDTNIPLKVISYKVGFCHPSAFSFAFKKMTGEAPRDFRYTRASGLTEAA